MIKWLIAFEQFLEDLIVNVFYDPIETRPQDLSMNSSDPIQPSIVIAPGIKKTNTEILYETAKAALGTRLAPASIAEVGCAVAVNILCKRSFGKEIVLPPNDTSTYWLYKTLAVSGLFDLVDIPEQGCIIISPTTMGNLPHGHTGILGKFGIMSN